MKECYSQFSENILTLGSEDSTISSLNKVLRCPFDSLSTQLCMNLKCQNNVFVCDSKTCLCQQNHKKCNTLNTSRFLTNINEKIISTQFIEKFIDDKVQQIIDYLSDFQEKTKSWIKEQQKYFGLNKNEKQFMKSVQMKTFSHINTNLIWQILHCEQIQKPLNQFINQNLSEIETKFKSIIKSIQNDLDKIKKNIESFDEKIFTNYSFFISHFNKTDSKSAIVTQKKQGFILQSFFQPMKIKSVRLLYKASQNQFSTLKFHQKCDGISDTLLFIETEFGKKIGGYTPVKWSSIKNGKYMDDESMKSFIFSLTNGDKFKMKSKQYAIQNDSQYGPIFGIGRDLILYDKGNINNPSSQINSTYINEAYSKNVNDSWQSFHGDPATNKFKINQWQVWKLQFSQQ